METVWYRVLSWFDDEPHTRVSVATADRRHADEWAKLWVQEGDAYMTQVVQVVGEVNS